MRKFRFVYHCLLVSIFSLSLFSCESPGNTDADSNDNVAYLFTYFTGNGEGEEAIRYALSKDGYNYYALNNNEPIIKSEEISNTGGVRDPHIIRGHDGLFRMVVTDLLTENGWNNIEMVLLKSKNLIDWESTIINIPNTFEDFSDVSRVWAPQTFYDQEEEKYMVYFSMLQPGSYDKIYYAYANNDFTELSTTPQQLFYNPNKMASIDGDIIEKDGQFHLFYKTEGNQDKGIKVAVSDSLTGGYEAMQGNVDQTDQAVEGSGVFKLIDSDKYILMYDVYMDGRYEFAESTDLKNFELVSQDISMNFHPRHGTVLPITQEEVNKLLEAFPSDDFPVITGSKSSDVKQNSIIVEEAQKSIYLPVKNGTNLLSFNPELETFAGIEIVNSEVRNFDETRYN